MRKSSATARSQSVTRSSRPCRRLADGKLYKPEPLSRARSRRPAESRRGPAMQSEFRSPRTAPSLSQRRRATARAAAQRASRKRRRRSSGRRTRHANARATSTSSITRLTRSQGRCHGVAGLTLRRLCLRRAGAFHGSEIQVEQGLLFVALVLVLLAQAQDFSEDFHVEALSLGLCEDFLLALVQRLDLLVDAFNALDEGANAIAGDSCRVSHACSLSKRHTRMQRK